MQDTVVPFTGLTKLDIPVDKILEGAKEANLKTVIVIGEDQNGESFLASSSGDLALMYWMLANTQKYLLD